MLEIKSKSLKDYIGTTPDEYTLKYHHYSLEIIDEKEEYSLVEQDIDNIYEYSKNTFMLYFSRIKDLKVALNNTNLIDKYHSDSYLRIRNNKEYEEYKSLNTNLNLIIELKDISSINIDRDSIIIQIDNVSELSIDELLVLNEKHLITGILLGQIAYIKNNYLDLIKELSDKYNIPVSNQLEIEKNNEINNDIYTVYDYMMLLNEIKRIIDETKDNDLIKHMHNIFLYLARSIYYDDEGVEHTNIDNQNLIGPLCNKKAVCEGYSKFIYQIYSLLGVETTVISGGMSKEEGGHIWNQVKVFNDWYNVDVTCQSTSEHNNLGFDWFLIKDDKCLFKPASPFAHEVLKDYKEK